MNVTKMSKHRVIKRPARGFHRFRSGVMNVAPKGAEKKIVEQNQKSPLLSLPSEIRACIWKYVLGGKVFIVTSATYGIHQTFLRADSYKFAPTDAEPKHGMALLRTCRQIYSEAVLYALHMCTFACSNHAELKRAVKTLKTYQRKHVTHLRLDCSAHYNISWIQDRSFLLSSLNLKKMFPALAQITVLIHNVTDAEYAAFEAVAASLPQDLHQALPDTGAALTVEGTPDGWWLDEEDVK